MFPIGVAVYSCILVVLHRVEQQLEMDQQKATEVILIIAGFVIAVCLIVFLVSLGEQSRLPAHL